MRFKIVSVGWNCADFLTQTLASIDTQTVTDYDVLIVDDATHLTDGGLQAQMIATWCEERDERWRYQINNEPHYVVRNQYDAIRALDPADDDVIVWLDLDGDRFSAPWVLGRLKEAYADGTLLTYGSYEPDPWDGWVPAVAPFKPDIVARNAYRSTITQGECLINHLRTMRGCIFDAIPVSYLQFGDGTWHESGTDYTFMVSGLELAGGRYKCLPEILCLYNSAQPFPENKRRPDATVRAVLDTAHKTPLEPLFGRG